MVNSRIVDCRWDYCLAGRRRGSTTASKNSCGPGITAAAPSRPSVRGRVAMKGCPAEAGLYEKLPATRFPPIPARRGSQGALAAHCLLSTVYSRPKATNCARRKNSLRHC
jgi:hypothetical protein